MRSPSYWTGHQTISTHLAPGILTARFWFICVLWCCGLGLLALPAIGAEARKRVVVLTSNSGDDVRTARATLDATRTLLAELAVDLVLTPGPRGHELAATTERARRAVSDNDAVAAVWLEEQEHTVVVYFYERAHARLLTRRVEVSESEAAAAEEVAVVLRSAVGAALEGADLMMTEIAVPQVSKPELPSAPPPPPPPMRARTGSQGELSFGYAGETVSGDANWQSGARLALVFAPAESVARIGLSVALWQTLEVETEAASLRVRRYPVSISAGIGWANQRFELRPELAAGAEYVRRSTERTASTLSAEPPSGRWLWSVSGRVRGQYALAPRVRVYASGGLQWLLNPHDEVVLGPVKSETLLAWAPLRPLAEAGLSVQIW
ncbi:MAG: hypothetical protein ACOY0T_30230 [Myxococcota bacterium]